MKKLPLFYFTPTLCWIDDNELFLNAANSAFQEKYNCLVFTDERKGLDFLHNYQSPYAHIQFINETIEEGHLDAHHLHSIKINISHIAELKSLKNIHNELAILIIDNHMPHLSGLAICHEIKDSAYKKILLTGQTELDNVIDAFNNGIIDKFIAKDKNVSEQLKKQIHQLTFDFFYEKTNHLIPHLEISHPSPLSDPIFCKFFYTWFESNDLSEFYLINRYGSFLVKDKDGNTTYFIVMSEHDKHELVHLNDEGLDEAGDILEKISRGEVIPFFGVGKEYWEFSYSEWGNYVYPATILEGREKYFWTIIKTEK